MLNTLRKVKYFSLELIHKTKKYLTFTFRRPKYSSKVFCIGYPKTGTTSVGKSLELLGYQNCSFVKKYWREYYLKGNYDRLVRVAAKFDSFDDLPWLKENMIPILDKAFPGSKFIYLARDKKSWKLSYCRWRKKVFNDSPDLEKEWTKYLAHQNFVNDYFAGRECDIIYLDIKDPSGFMKLASFLQKSAPQEQFPHINKT